MPKATLQKNPRRLALELRQQPDRALWKKWVIEIRQILMNYELEHGGLPVRPSKIARIDWLRRMFDSHGSSLIEAIIAPHDFDEYWTRLAEHPGGSYTDSPPFESVNEHWQILKGSPNFNRNTLEYHLHA